MLNVCHFANTIIGRPGNIGVRTERIIKALSEKGIRGYCLSRISERRSTGFVYRDMGWLGHIPRILKAVKIYLLPEFNFRYPAIKLFEWFALRHLPETLIHFPGVAHVWDACPNLIRSLKSAGYPVVLDIPIAPGEYAIRISAQYGLDFLKVHQSSLNFHRESYHLADIILAPSQFVAEELVAVGVTQDKIRVVEFGVDVVSSTGNSSVVKQKLETLDFVFVGSVSRRKGVDLLLNAWGDARFKDDRLHLCGRVFPEINPYLKHGDNGSIVTPGFIKPFDYLPKCDVFVFPSWLEGSAKAVYEAMACSLPVIVTRSSGSIVRDGVDGFVIDAGDTNALRERMLWFKDNPQQIKGMGTAAAERVRDFTWERYADRVIGVYRELVAKSSTPNSCSDL